MTRATKIMLHFDNASFLKSPDAIAYEPSCHAVARAYAEAFDVGYQDGWKHTILPRKYLFFWKPLYRYGHTWNILKPAEDITIVLDLFPEGTCSLMPMMLAQRDARYAYQRLSASEQQALTDHMSSKSSLEQVAALKKEFLRIEAL